MLTRLPMPRRSFSRMRPRRKVQALIDEEGNPELKLRVFVRAAAARASSTASPSTRSPTKTNAMEKNGVKLLIDPMSYQYLVGAEIDYNEGLDGAQFVIKNPNATTTCGCGSSFTAS